MLFALCVWMDRAFSQKYCGISWGTSISWEKAPGERKVKKRLAKNVRPYYNWKDEGAALTGNFDGWSEDP